MNTSSTDRIEKEVRLSASPARVWRAISDSAEFGRWFGVRLGDPFVPGTTVRGPITYPGYEHLTLVATIERMEPERYFSFRWHPHAMDPEVDYSNDPTTLVEFRLEPLGEGTLLRVSESGFDGIPEEVRRESFFRNEGGWTLQMDNIKRHVGG